MTRVNYANAAVALFFLVLTLVGLLCCGDYGLPCDEPAEQVILQENMHEYAWRLLGEQSDAASYYESRGIQRISQSIERDHGECAYYLATPLLSLATTAPDTLTTLWHAYTWLWFMLGVFALYGFCRETGLSRPIACAGSLLLYLCPRFFAEGHYNNKDMVLLTLVLLSLWLGVRFLKQPGFVRGLLLSLVGAMATNTKIVGAVGWGLMGLCAVVLVTAKRAWNKRMANVAVVTVLSYAVFYALLTPALWADPLAYFPYVLSNASGFTRWTGVVVFRGAVFDHAINPLPRYYLPYMMLVTLPLYTLPLGVVGQLSTIGHAVRQRKALLQNPVTLSLLAATLLWLVPLGFAALTRPLVYNGWRHFYFVYAGVAVLAAHGLQAVWRFARRLGDATRVIVAALLCICFVSTGSGILANHPHQYAYYNALAASTAQTDMELDYWDVSTLGAMKQLITAERNTSLPLTLGARDDMSWFGVEHAYAVLSGGEREQLQVAYDGDAPYLFYNTTYALIYGVDAPQGYHVLFTVDGYGNTLCTVYERDA